MEIIKKNQEIYNELIIISNEENYIKNYDLVYQIIYMCLDLSIKKEDIITICQYFFDEIKINKDQEKKIILLLSSFLIGD